MLHTEKCPHCGTPFTVNPDSLCIDDTGTHFCSLPCMQIAGLFVGQKENDDIFSQMFTDTEV